MVDVDERCDVANLSATVTFQVTIFSKTTGCMTVCDRLPRRCSILQNMLCHCCLPTFIWQVYSGVIIPDIYIAPLQKPIQRLSHPATAIEKCHKKLAEERHIVLITQVWYA